MASPGRKEEPVARPFFRWAAAPGGTERGLVAAMAPAVSVNPFIKPVMLVTLKVQDTQRRVVTRTLRRTDKLRDLMDCYHDVAGTRGGAGRFVFDGKRLEGEQTPEGLGMKSGDQVDFFGDHGGGDAEAEAEAEEEDEVVVDRKPAIEPAADVTVTVKDTAGRTVKWTVRSTQIKLEVLMNAYYARVPGVTRGTGKFLYDGRRLTGEQTLAELKMEDGDEILIDFFVDMMGGGGAGWAAEQTPVPA